MSRLTTSLLSFVVSLQAVLYVQSREVQHLMSGVGFLQKYGYMDEPDPLAAELISEINVRQSVMMMQRFMGLTQTGEIDEETAGMMAQPRCGVPDISRRGGRWYGGRTRGYRGGPGRARRYDAQGIRWYKNELTYSFDDYTPDMSRDQVRDSLARAFKTWSEVTPLRFREVLPQGDVNPDIHIKFSRRSHGDDYPFDGPGGTLAHAFFPGENIGGDAHFDDDELFTYASYQGTNLFIVAAHELGHSLGLGHSDVPGALMAPYYQGYDSDFQLPYDDIAGIQSLYGSNPRKPPRPQPRPTSPPEPTDPPVTAKPTPSPTCVGKFSAVSDIRREIFIFKKDQMWRLSSSGTPLPGYPMLTSRFWQDAPSDADAVFEKLDGTIVFIKGSRYWEFNGLNLKGGFPQDLSRFTGGKPSQLDAALSLRQEAKTYLFRGALCWRYDGLDERMEDDYPKLITEEWVGGPDRVDAAFSSKENTYLVKGNQYWQFSDGSMTAEAEVRWLTVDFLGCSEDTVITDDGDSDGDGGGNGGGIPGDATRTASGLWICVASALVALLFFR